MPREVIKPKQNKPTETKKGSQASERFIHLKSADYTPGKTYTGKYYGSYVDKMYGDTRYMLKTSEGMVVFKELKQLKDIFSALQKGDVVEIKYVEKKKLDKGRTLQVFQGTKLTGKESEITFEAPEEDGTGDDDSMPF